MTIKRLNLSKMQPKIIPGLFLAILLSISGCDAIAGIFKTGVGVGAFIVIVVVLLILAFVMMGRRR